MDESKVRKRIAAHARAIQSNRAAAETLRYIELLTLDRRDGGILACICCSSDGSDTTIEQPGKSAAAVPRSCSRGSFKNARQPL